MSEKFIQIYTLSHPITKQVFYVGASGDTIRNIIYRHTNSFTHIGVRKELRQAGLQPIVHFIDGANDLIEVGQLEEYWIWQFKAWGFKLDNIRVCSGYKGSSNAYMSYNWRKAKGEQYQTA